MHKSGLTPAKTLGIFLLSFFVTSVCWWLFTSSFVPVPPLRVQDGAVIPHWISPTAILFQDIIRWVASPLSILSLLLPLLLLVWVSLLAIKLRRSAMMPPAYVREITALIHEHRFDKAYSLSLREPSPLGQLIAAGMKRWQYGLDEVRLAARNTALTLWFTKTKMVDFLILIVAAILLFSIVTGSFGMFVAHMKLLDPNKG